MTTFHTMICLLGAISFTNLLFRILSRIESPPKH